MISLGVASFTTSIGRELFPRIVLGPLGPVIHFFDVKGEPTATAYYAATLCGRDGTPPMPGGVVGIGICGGGPGEFFDRETVARLIHYAAGVFDAAVFAEEVLKRRESSTRQRPKR